MIESLVKSLSILEFIASRGGEPVSIKEICAEFGFPQPTVSHIIRTFCSRKYLEKQKRSGYALGPMPYQLTKDGAFRADLVHCARPEIQALSDSIQSYVCLNTLFDNRLIVLCSANNNPNAIQVKTDVVSEADPLSTATGHVLAAHLKDAELDHFVRTYTDSPEAAQELLARLAEIRDAGTARIDGENMNLVKVAFPVLENGTAVGALGAMIVRFQVADLDETCRKVQACAARITQRIAE